MNKRTLQSFYVGLTAIFGVAFLVIGIGWLSNAIKFGHSLHYTVVFNDAKGLSKGSTVQMSGVTVGSVDDVELTHGQKIDGHPVPDNQAQLAVSINPGFHIPQGSHFIIRSSLIGSTPSLVVDPNPTGGADIPDRSVIAGASSPGLDSLLAESQPLVGKVDKLLTKVTLLTDSVTKITQDVGDLDTQHKLKKTIGNMEATTEKLPHLLDHTEAQLDALSSQTQTLLKTINRAAVSGEAVANNAQGLTSDLRATLNENRKGLTRLLRTANDTAYSVSVLTSSLTSTVGNKDIQRSLVTASQNLADMTAKLNATTDDLNRLSGDPRVSENIRETVATFRETAENLRETSTSIRNIAARVETIHIPGERRQTTAGTAPVGPTSRKPAAPSLLEPGLVLNSVYDTTVSRLRVDTDFTLLTGRQGNFYRAGLYDLTYGNRIDLQVGLSNGHPATSDLRYGILAGKLGVGTDFRAGMLDFRLDAYDPNSLTLNARAKAFLNSDTSLLFGVDSIGSGKYSNRATFGVQIRR